MSVVWWCVSRLEYIVFLCDACMVLDSILEEVILNAINQVFCDKDHFLITLQNNIKIVVCHKNSHTFSEIDQRFEAMQSEILKLASSKAD
jgi:site-specific DNA recombinase